MGVRIISAHMGSVAVMYDSVTDWAFGPVFYDEGDYSAEERIQHFLEWLQVDARSLTDVDLEGKRNEWYAQEKELWKKYEEERERKYLEDTKTDGVQ